MRRYRLCEHGLLPRSGINGLAVMLAEQEKTGHFTP